MTYQYFRTAQKAAEIVREHREAGRRAYVLGRVAGAYEVRSWED